MNLRTLLIERNMSMYKLSKISGVPNTTVIDICSGKSSIEGCNAGTVFRLAKALNCSMEEIMMIDTSNYGEETGLPKNDSYLEKGLPTYLAQSLAAMKRSWEIEDNGGRDIHWDIYWCELNADINTAEVDQSISKEQAQYLRRNYLRMEESE
ncbi:MAG: helix-turn-helix transcriptional regulator [Eubacteriales bacterium]|nr:helix-turn-helix transcriptional regulator [Eubacteriales bacterium]